MKIETRSNVAALRCKLFSFVGTACAALTAAVVLRCSNAARQKLSWLFLVRWHFVYSILPSPNPIQFESSYTRDQHNQVHPRIEAHSRPGNSSEHTHKATRSAHTTCCAEHDRRVQGLPACQHPNQVGRLGVRGCRMGAARLPTSQREQTSEVDRMRCVHVAGAAKQLGLLQLSRPTQLTRTPNGFLITPS